MTDELCGYETPNGPCQNPATEGDSCWIESHGGHASGHGQPKKLKGDSDEQERRRQILFAVAGDGLKVHHQASLAGVSTETLRRSLCCVENPSDPRLDEDPCDFCGNYARARARGAREVLSDCKTEFVASASYGYTKTEKREVTGEGGGPLELNVNETVVETDYED